MTLYDINTEIFNCFYEEIDAETGEVKEILDAEKLKSLEMQKAEKVENIGCFIKNLVAEAEALKAEEEKLAKRRKTAENKAAWLKGYLLVACNGERYKGIRADVQFRSTPTVAVDNINLIPPEYIRTKVITEPDKIALKKALQAGDVPGAHIEKALSTIVK